MTTSRTKEWTPAAKDLIEQAYVIAGIDPQVQGYQHDKLARTAINLMFSEWMTTVTPEWLKRQEFLPITAGETEYNLADEVYEGRFNGLDDIESGVILEADAQDANSVLQTFRMTAQEYNEYRTGIVGRPYGYWFERRETPILHWTYTPERDTTFRFIGVYRPDVVLTSRETPDIPFRWHAAFTYGLGARLLSMLSPENQPRLLAAQANADKAFMEAQVNEDDGTNLNIENYAFAGMGSH